MIVNDGVTPTEIEKFCKKASRLTLSQVVDTVVVKERLTVKGSNRAKEFTIEISFFPREEYRSEYDVDSPEILSSFGIRFPNILKKEILLEMKKLDADLKGQITALGKGKAVRDNGADTEEVDDGDGDAGPSRADDDASEVGDGDADEVKQANKKKEMTTYESDDDDDLDDEAIEAKFASDDMGDAEDDGGNQQKEPKKNSTTEIQSLFMENCSFARSFKFDSKGCKIKLSVSFLYCNWLLALNL